jgi:hypothetical protein
MHNSFAIITPHKALFFASPVISSDEPSTEYTKEIAQELSSEGGEV